MLEEEIVALETRSIFQVEGLASGKRFKVYSDDRAHETYSGHSQERKNAVYVQDPSLVWARDL
jgi:hypothetical protein